MTIVLAETGLDHVPDTGMIEPRASHMQMIYLLVFATALTAVAYYLLKIYRSKSRSYRL